MERCCICDYTSEDGSALADVAPNEKIFVRWVDRFSGFYCTVCEVEITSNIKDLAVDDNVEGEVPHELILG